jgi:hypothetical protein
LVDASAGDLLVESAVFLEGARRERQNPSGIAENIRNAGGGASTAPRRHGGPGRRSNERIGAVVGQPEAGVVA